MDIILVRDSTGLYGHFARSDSFDNRRGGIVARRFYTQNDHTYLRV
jgi:hypothetical protein